MRTARFEPTSWHEGLPLKVWTTLFDGILEAWICNTIFSTRQRRIMPTNGFWRTGKFLFLSVSAILILLFHRLLALEVGIVPCTRNTHKPWTFILENSADPLWALLCTLTGHPHGMKFCTLGMNEKHTLFVSRRLRTGRECVVVHTGNWHLMLFNAPLTTGYEEFCIGNPRGKHDSDVQNCAGRANWRCTVVTKDWLIGRWQHKTVKFGSNISIRFYIFAANEHATYVKCSACALKGLAKASRPD